jgi:hypothetical protein
MTNFIYHDGGRAAAGFKGKAGDCVTRAIAIAANLPYQYVYDAMAAGNESQRTTKRSSKTSGRRTANSGISVKRKWFKDWMVAHGFRWVPTMGIGTGCKVHLRASELPAGKLVCSVSRHYVAMIGGTIFDTYNPSRGGDRCVYGYWVHDPA